MFLMDFRVIKSETLNIQKTPGHLLHNAILGNNFRQFRILLRVCRRGINHQNKNGDTPLLMCLKLGRPHEFIESLLSAGANIMIPNKEGTSPLSFALAHCSYTISLLLLEKSADLPFTYKTRSLSKILYEAISTGEYRLRTFIINRGLDSEKILVGIITLYNNNVIVSELNVFLDQIEADENINKDEFTYLCATLLMNSMFFNTAVIFKSVWNKTHLENFASVQPTFLYDFIINCYFGNSEFVECLRLILTCPYAGCFTSCLHEPLQTTFYKELFWKFLLREVNKHDRMLTISSSVQLVCVTIEDIRTAYNYFGFNEEVVVLLQHFQPSILNRADYFIIAGFLTALENDYELSVNGVNNLDLVTRLSYRKLINCVPEVVFTNNKKLKLLKSMLNQVPTLFEMSKHSFQKSLQKFYNIQDLDQFGEAVENLRYLPTILKKNLCQEPPIYYK
ncbi:hypothetical protein ILUMI_13417 [Ignelater luminosus]|uniref:Ankyrin repeat protein n=1 Tax=Ignelater luminosus TaxID=2038154 RepID=A0A8K0CUJ3_IGNLU|nr:hypothetical protein ILUMI_13417 [Ignelater luminosus]